MYGQEIVGSFTSPRVATVHAAAGRQMAAVISKERSGLGRGAEGKDKEKYGRRLESLGKRARRGGGGGARGTRGSRVRKMG